MQHIRFNRLQVMFASIAVLVMMLLVTACAGTGSTTTSSGQSQTNTSVTQTSATQTTVTQAQPTATQQQQPVATQQPVAFKAGGISFIGPVKSITSSRLVMTAPNGQAYTMAINAQTDLSAYNGGLPAVGSSVDMDSAINPDGSLTATALKPAQPGDPDISVIAYTGITTSAVGADRVIHFTAGTKSYNLTIPAAADLSDFGGNAQAIGLGVSVKVKISYPTNTIVSIGNANA